MIEHVGDFAAPLAVVGVALFFAAVALFQWLWNITIPELFGQKQIRYWQAFRLVVICAILFKG